MSPPLDLIFDLLIPVISLSGLAGGILLSYLAPEEVVEGRKYFILLYRILFIFLAAVIIYFVHLFVSFSIIMLFFFLAIVLLVLDIKKSYPRLFLFHYLLFLTGYFITGKQMIVAALLFLYGLPLGTLLRVKDE